MGIVHFDALPDDRRDVALGALRSVLGAVPVDVATPLAGGITTAAVFRIEAGGRKYLLRVEGAPSPMRNPHQYVSMQVAADAGIAPQVHHVDEAGRVAVTDFIDAQPLDLYPGGLCARAEALGALLRDLRTTPVFPYFADYPDVVGRRWAHVCRTGLFSPGVLDPVNERLTEIRKAYVWDRANSVSCHNDPVPGNILFDGRRLWLIDWEGGCCNDPLVDVSVVMDHLARAPELEEALLQAWLGRAPDEALRARLSLARALTRLYYAGVMFSASALAPRTAPDDGLSAPTYSEFEDAIRTGRLASGNPHKKHVMGKMFLASFLRGVPTPRV